MVAGNSLSVQWLGLSAFTAVAQVQSLVRELRSCKLCGVAKKKKKKTNLRELLEVKPKKVGAYEA